MPSARSSARKQRTGCATSISSATSRRTPRAAASSGCASSPTTTTGRSRLFINSAGGNVTDGLAIHDAVRHIISRGIEVTIIVQGMAYSMGSIVLQAASDGKRLAFPHSWIMIHEPAKWAGWQSTTAAAQHLERLKQMQDQIYKILSSRSGKPLRQIIRDTKRTDFYLDAQSALEYGLIDAVVAGELPGAEAGSRSDAKDTAPPVQPLEAPRQAEAARERPAVETGEGTQSGGARGAGKTG